jgi:prepilin-type N-terminal cleavage/methylation domain-containing protein
MKFNMKKDFSAERGFTLIEIMTSMALFVIILAGVALALNASTHFASYTKHKAQALYVAQQTIEAYRRYPFGQAPGQLNGTVTLDPSGTFNNQGDDFRANRIVTVTPVTGNAFLERVQVEINWQERIMGGSITMREYLSVNIANETQLN